ncbi:hypothetical protein IDH44_14555 [Paenibacillus sp. IB182496]|uniref:Regulatory protein YycH domain-containing protein n=1 Tax=Paenibacillus sabuli TaxID=2772509 RepID=A0A927GS69_9BACL|nr:two-component system activity regulator YycH [Paenibacillus sabuli]MBD2846419.1 hypothetical protein [Paenibacillus sabuli]
MMEKAKTGALALLVALSLLQSYFLAYSFPSLGARESSEMSYVPTEKMGPEERIENLLFPENMVLHFGGDRHTVLYPDTVAYNQIWEKLQSREFRGFQRIGGQAQDWEQVRSRYGGIELRFGYGVPPELLRKVLRLEEDMLLMEERIARIWIYRIAELDQIRVYLFSADGQTVYESRRADITVSDIHEYISFGARQPMYRTTDGNLYLPEQPLEAMEATATYDMYTPDQLLRNLNFDAGATKSFKDRSGTQIYTDSKRGLQVEQDGRWVRFTNPVAVTDSATQPSDSAYTAVSFVNSHGGWDGLHRLVLAGSTEYGRSVLFQQYYLSRPLLSAPLFRIGAMRLTVQQGVVTDYERSLVTLSGGAAEHTVRYLPGGDELAGRLAQYERRFEVEALYPALRTSQAGDMRVRLTPVWAVRLRDGTQETLASALPAGMEVEPAQAAGADKLPTGGEQDEAGGGAQDGAQDGASADGPDEASGVDAEGGETGDASGTGGADDAADGASGADADSAASGGANAEGADDSAGREAADGADGTPADANSGA